MLKMKPRHVPSLKERIAEIEAEVTALVEERANLIKKDCDNQPLEVIRYQIRRGECSCKTALRLLSEGD